MPVVINIDRNGTYKKQHNKTAVVGILPNRLNEDPHRYGLLKEENQMDLKKGCRGFRDQGDGDLFYSFFDYIKKTSQPGIPLREAVGADFISTRRNLISFAASVYSRSFFVIRALRKNGVIFLCDKKSENDNQCNYGGGYKFEQYMTLKANGKPHDEYERVSNAECIKAVLRTSFKKEDEEIKVLYAAEMDAQDGDGNFVEFKSTVNDQDKWLNRSSLNHYLQSYLGGVSCIVKGQATSEKIVFKVDKIQTDDIPAMGVNWNAGNCFEKLYEILQEIKRKLEYDDEAIVIRVQGAQIYYDVENGENCKFVDPNFLRFFE